MSIKLKVFLIIILLLVLIYILKSINNNSISTKHALIWVFAVVFGIISILTVEHLFVLARYLSIENVSNMIFFLTFVFLIIICFNLSKQLSIQNKKIINLTQELGILINREKKGIKND